MNQWMVNLIAAVLAAIANENRIRIIEFLRGGEKCNCEIYPALEMEQSNLSRHMRVLLDAGILVSRKKGPRIFYRVSDPVIFELMDLAGQLVKSQLRRKAELLTEL